MSSRSSRRRSSTSVPIRAGSSSGEIRSSAAASRSSDSSCARCASAAAPVSVSIRRTPAATGLSETILKRPMSPVRRTWVPPQSSTEKGRAEAEPASRSSPMATTRTSSPYFSPKSASAPALTACSGVIRRVVTSLFSRMRVFTSDSIACTSSGESGRGWLKSKRMRSGATSDPFCVTCSPSRRRSA